MATRGCAWGVNSVQLNPSLNGQIGGIVLHDHASVTARIAGLPGRVLDTLHLNVVKARFVRIRVSAASSKKLPMLEELSATR
jgi:hypothetical protein